MTLLLLAGLLGGLTLLISATGFVRVVWFVSIGYAYSVAAMALALAIVLAPGLGPGSWIQLGLLCLYGLRLGTYILRREGRPAYRRELGDVHAREAGVGPAKRIPIWLGVSLLYLAMLVPALSPALAGSDLADRPATWLTPDSPASRILTWLGVAIQALGFGLETLADAQKNRYKQSHPERYCDTGLYRLVRCPNYLGEILVWCGSFVAGFWAFGAWWQWTAGLAGLVCIVLIMMGSTKRLEARQAERYAQLPDYQDYCRRVPVLFPWVPVYSLKNLRVFLE